MKDNLLSIHMFNHCHNRILKQLIVLVLLTSPIVANAMANLLVTPTRIVFEERTRTAQVTLMNNGTDQGDFRISFINQNMTDDGQFIAVKADEKGMFANTMVRYSPRQISLAPGQSQVVRLMLRKPRNLEEGEYRSHLLFQSIPKASKSSLESVMDTEPEGISIEITPIIGISIPIIIRHGNLHSELKLDNARIIPGNEGNPVSKISIDMHRIGNRSVYGDFRAILTPNAGGEPIVIALANGIAIYTPNTLRHFTIPLRLPEGTSLNEGKVRILFLESGKDEKTGLIAETMIPQ